MATLFTADEAREMHLALGAVEVELYQDGLFTTLNALFHHGEPRSAGHGFDMGLYAEAAAQTVMYVDVVKDDLLGQGVSLPGPGDIFVTNPNDPDAMKEWRVLRPMPLQPFALPVYRVEVAADLTPMAGYEE